VKFIFKFLTVISPIILFQICGIGYAESEIPHVFKYSLATRNMNYEHSVIFKHSNHAMEYKISCVDCHHQLEPGAEAVKQNCLDCHGSKAIRSKPPNRRSPAEKKVQPYLIVLHDMCVGCHKELKAYDPYSKVPVACWRCHVRKRKSGIN